MKLISKTIICIIAVGGIIILLPFVVPGLYFVRIPSKNDIKVETIRNMVRNDIPLGSSRKKVSEWLSTKKISFGFMDGKKYDLNYESSSVRSGIPIEKLGGFISVKIPNSSRGILTEWSISMLFFFDKQDKLLKYEIYEQSYGF